MSITREWASGLDFFLLFTEYFSVREHNTYSHIYTSACVYCLALPTGPNPCQSEEVTHLPRSLWSCLYPIFLARDAHTLQDGPASPLRLLNCEAIFWTHIYKRCPLGCRITAETYWALDRGHVTEADKSWGGAVHTLILIYRWENWAQWVSIWRHTLI